MKKIETGKRGEDAALAWLEERGFRLLDRNWRSGHKEIDLVMESEAGIHFVEVKTLTLPAVIRPEEKVDGRKQAALIAAAGSYLAGRHVAKEVQFDVVSVILGDGPPSVEYIPQAFFPIRFGR